MKTNLLAARIMAGQALEVITVLALCLLQVACNYCCVMGIHGKFCEYARHYECARFALVMAFSTTFLEWVVIGHVVIYVRRWVKSARAEGAERLKAPETDDTLLRPVE